MTAWTDACPVCWLSVRSHTDEQGRAHYERWQRIGGNPAPRALSTEAGPSLTGEYDQQQNIVLHRARA